MAGNIYKKIVLGGLGLGGLAVVGGLIAASFGLMNVSARPPHTAATTFALHNVFKASIGRAAKSAPDAPDLSDLGLIHLGAQHYAQVCSSCHGGPELGQSPVSLSMRPRPQHLPAVVDQFEDAELYEVLRNGVRFSAMPSWPADENFGEIWSVVAFLRQLPEMSHEDYVAMTTTEPVATAPQTFAWQSRGESAPLTLHAMAPPIEEYLYAAPSTGWRPIGLGDAPIAYCAACHGADGTGAISGGHAPNLTIHSSDFIATRLRDYASGRQASGIMATVATSLSEPQIDALANYYANLGTSEIQDAPPPVADPIGEQIVLAGIHEQAIPGCANCHSNAALEVMPTMPAIAGQNFAFLESRLNGFQAADGTVGLKWNPMHAFASRLSDDQITAVAAYLAGISPNDPLATAPLQSNEMLAIETINSICSTCHEATLAGASGAHIPNLTLQSPQYIKWQLAQFHDGQRNNSQMRQAAQRLDKPTIEALADYIGNLPAVPTTESRSWEPVEAELLTQAEALAQNGDPDRGIEACTSCHVEANNAISLIPRLSGQQPGYLHARLTAFSHENDSLSIGNSPMRGISSALSADERRALADYFSQQAVIEKPL